MVAFSFIIIFGLFLVSYLIFYLLSVCSYLPVCLCSDIRRVYGHKVICLCPLRSLSSGQDAELRNSV